MSTEYDIWCNEHDEGWPGGAIGLRHYQIPAAFEVIAHRAAVMELGTLKIDWEVSPWHLPGLYELAEFFRKHEVCALRVFDEYGREVDAEGHRTGRLRGPAA